MKKLMLGAVLLMAFTSSSIAQQAATATKETKKTPATKVEQTKPVVKKKDAATVVTTKPTVSPTAKPVAAQGVVLKKDGTPDKRFKNAAATEKGPLKKDGTADMRYKKNKKG